MSKWKKMTIGDFITLQRGHDLTNKEREIGNVPVYGAAGKNGYHSKSLANGPGLIIGRSGGSFGKVYFVKENYWPHNTSLYTTDFKGNDPRFAFYLLTQMDLTSLNSGSAQPSLNRNYIYPLPIEVPEPDQQRKIAAVLSALDDKIELNNQINTELEQMAKALFDYWFVQFDFPNVDGKPYKSSGGKMKYNELLKREVPEGWEVNNIGGYIKYNRGISYTSKTIDECKGTPMINLKSFNLNGTYRVDGLKYYNGTYTSGKVLNQNDLLIAITDVTREAEIIGKAIFVPDLGDKIVCSCDVAQVIPDEEKLNSAYLKFLFNSEYYHNYIKYFASGTLVLHLDLNGVSWFTDIIPPIELQRRFGKLVNNIESKIQSNSKQNQELSNLSNWLLPMLMSGQAKINFDGANSSMALKNQSVNESKQILNIPANKKAFAKQVLAGKIVSTFKADPNFTDIKFQKVQFLAEHIIAADLNLNYYYQAAGPYDNKFMHSIYEDFRKQKWFDCINKQFVPLEKQEKIEGYYQGYFASMQKQLDTLFDILYPLTEAEAEIVATLYAISNNHILENRQITDEELIAEFYLWSDRKQRYNKSQIENGLKFLRRNQIEPKGFGQLIKRAKNKH